MIGDVIYSLLSNDATVSSIVGVKIYPSMALQEIALPYIVYDESNNQPTNTKDGKSELDVVSYDIEIYAENPSDLSSLAYAVRNCLDRYTGIIGGKRIDSVKYVTENSGYSLEDRVYLRVHNYDFRYFPLVQTLRQPTNLVATGNTTNITLTWVDNATGETGYKVYRGTSLYELDLLATISANLQTYVDSTPLANTVYYYYVVPYSTLGNGYCSNVVAQKLGNITEIDITFDTIPLGTATTSPYNIDCDTPIQIVIVTDAIYPILDGTYIYDGVQTGFPKYVKQGDATSTIFNNGPAWQIVRGVNSINSNDNTSLFPYLVDWQGDVTMVQGTISDYCGGGTAPDGEFYINLVKVADVPSGGNASAFVTLDGVNAGTYNSINNTWEVVSDPCADATYTIKDSAATVLYSGAIASGGDLNQTITDAVITNSDASYSTTVVAEGTKVLADTTYNIYVNGVLDQSFSVPTLKTETINITP